jgi:hypothetical protein
MFAWFERRLNPTAIPTDPEPPSAAMFILFSSHIGENVRRVGCASRKPSAKSA